MTGAQVPSWVRSVAIRICRARNALNLCDDAIQEGHLAYLQARKRYLPTKGATLKTFARHRVEGAIKDFLYHELQRPTESLDDVALDPAGNVIGVITVQKDADGKPDDLVKDIRHPPHKLVDRGVPDSFLDWCRVKIGEARDPMLDLFPNDADMLALVKTENLSIAERQKKARKVYAARENDIRFRGEVRMSLIDALRDAKRFNKIEPGLGDELRSAIEGLKDRPTFTSPKRVLKTADDDLRQRLFDAVLPLIEPICKRRFAAAWKERYVDAPSSKTKRYEADSHHLVYLFCNGLAQLRGKNPAESHYPWREAADILQERWPGRFLPNPKRPGPNRDGGWVRLRYWGWVNDIPLVDLLQEMMDARVQALVAAGGINSFQGLDNMHMTDLERWAWTFDNYNHRKVEAGINGMYRLLRWWMREPPPQS